MSNKTRIVRMRLKPEESKRLADHLFHQILQEKTVVLKAQRQLIRETIEKVLLHHFEEEHQIDKTAERLYQEEGASHGAMDRGKAIQMIRKQLAQEKDFILSGGMEGRFSEDKISHMAHLVADQLYDDDLLDFKDEDEGPQFCKRVFTKYFGDENQAAERARKKIASMSNAPFEGSRDWEVLYRKFYEEEMKRLGHQ